MALSFGAGLSQGGRDARDAITKSRKANRDAFQSFMEDAVTNNQNLTVADLENQKMILTGGDFLLSSQLGNKAVMKELAKKHNEKVFNNTLTMATKNIKQSSERENAYDKSVGVDDTYDQFKKKLLPTLGQTPELQEEAWNSLGWNDETKFMQKQEDKRIMAIDTIFNSESFKSVINSEADVDTIYGQEKKMSAWMVNGLKARFREGREKTVEDIVVGQTTKMLDNQFDSKQVFDMIKTYSDDSSIEFDQDFLNGIAENRLRALGIANPSTDQIKRVVDSIKSNVETNKRAYKGQFYTDFLTEFRKDDYIKNYMASKGDRETMPMSTFKLALKSTAKKFGWNSDDIFLKETETGKEVLNPKIAGLIGFDELEALRKELTKDYINKNTKEAKEKAATYVKENITPKKSKENMGIYFNSANLDPDKDGATIGMLNALTTKYFIPPNLGGAGAVLDQMVQAYDPEIHTDMGAYIDTIAANTGLKSVYDTSNAVLENLINKRRFEGVEPDTPIEQYTNEYEKDIMNVEEEVTKIIKSLPENYISQMVAGGDFIWNSKGLAAYTNVVASAKQKLALMKQDIISDFSHQNLHNFNEILSSSQYKRVINGEETHLVSREQFKNYLLGLIEQQEKFLDEQVDKIKPTGDVPSVGLTGVVAEKRTGLNIADNNEFVSTVNQVHSQSQNLTTLESFSLTNPNPNHILVPAGTSDGTLALNPKYTGISGFTNLSAASGGVENNPFVLVFDLLNENNKLGKQDTIDVQTLGEQAENILLVSPSVSNNKLTIRRKLNKRPASSGSTWDKITTLYNDNRIRLYEHKSFYNTANREKAFEGVVGFDKFFQDMMFIAHKYRKQNPK